jgi:hypothetical protein
VFFKIKAGDYGLSTISKAKFYGCLKDKVHGYFSRIINKAKVRYNVKILTINFTYRVEGKVLKIKFKAND